MSDDTKSPVRVAQFCLSELVGRTIIAVEEWAQNGLLLRFADNAWAFLSAQSDWEDRLVLSLGEDAPEGLLRKAGVVTEAMRKKEQEEREKRRQLYEELRKEFDHEQESSSA